ncbi:MAG: hypothetical protein NTY81_03990 [Candidatus Staskawiczbacteria bacterium]|nr:hypothetical protein [Candidatus Staskawiczbacteria bacterium]
MNKKTAFLVLLAVVFTLPITAHALVNSIQTLSVAVANVVWVVFTGIAVICFIIAGIMFLTAGGAPEKLGTARASLIWGIAGIIVAILAFSIINIVTTALT